MSYREGSSKYWSKPKKYKDPKIVKCLKCNIEFESSNRKTNRLCSTCNHQNTLMFGGLPDKYQVNWNHSKGKKLGTVE